MIKGGSIKLVNQIHHSCLEIKKENYQNVARTEENIKHLVLWTGPTHLADSQWCPVKLISLEEFVSDLISAIGPCIHDTHTYPFFLLSVLHILIIGKPNHN